jgi:hypothetical protein
MSDDSITAPHIPPPADVAALAKANAAMVEQIRALEAEVDRLTPPHCQHAGDPGHDIGHGVHPDRGGPSLVETLTAERDRRITPEDHARAVRDAYADAHVRAAMDAGDFGEGEAGASWLGSDARAALLARVGPDVLAEVER